MSDATLDDKQGDDAQDETPPAGTSSPYAYSSGGDDEEETLSPFAAALRAVDDKPDEDQAEPEGSDSDDGAASGDEAADDPIEEGADAAPIEAESPDPEPAAASASNESASDETTETEADGDAELELLEEEEPEPISPYDLPGDWYVVHSYSGYENKVKTNLMTRTSSMHMEDRIFEVVIPMENVVEIKNGQRVEVPKKMFPGYILVRMYLDDDSWYAVRNTPGVTGFVGSGSKPTPLSRREVERFLGAPKAEEKKSPRFKPAWEIGETVRVITGPFADFNGVIEDINVDQQKVTVLVSIFGRDTPMELNFEDIQKQ